MCRKKGRKEERRQVGNFILRYYKKITESKQHNKVHEKVFQSEVGRSGFSVDVIDGAVVVMLLPSDPTRKSFE